MRPVLHGVATWWDGVELWLTQLPFALQVALVVAVIGPLCWGAAAVIDSVVERTVAARLAAIERARSDLDRADTGRSGTGRPSGGR